LQRREILITDAMAGRTAESILKNEFEMAKARISHLKRTERGLLCNGERIYTTVRVQAGDLLSVQIGDDPPQPTAAPVPIPLDIVYEDAYLLVINKPAPLPVQPTRREDEVSLEHGLAAYLKNGDVAHPASRLDKCTTGLMTVAKNGYTHELLRRRMHSDGFRKEYRGIAVGHVTPAHGHIRLPIGFYEGSSYQRAIRDDGAPSHTEYETLAVNGDLALLRLVPHTGRTHQLRLHMASIGYPLAGDFLYGTEDASLIDRAALHSAELWLTHPITGEALHFSCPLPADMQRLMDMPPPSIPYKKQDSTPHGNA